MVSKKMQINCVWVYRRLDTSLSMRTTIGRRKRDATPVFMDNASNSGVISECKRPFFILCKSCATDDINGAIDRGHGSKAEYGIIVPLSVIGIGGESKQIRSVIAAYRDKTSAPIDKSGTVKPKDDWVTSRFSMVVGAVDLDAVKDLEGLSEPIELDGIILRSSSPRVHDAIGKIQTGNPALPILVELPTSRRLNQFRIGHKSGEIDGYLIRRRRRQ